MFTTLLAFVLISATPEYNSVYVTMDGCIPCTKLHNEIGNDLTKNFNNISTVNISHLSKEEKELTDCYKVRVCPTYLIFKKVNDKNTYIGRTEGYMDKKEFFDAIDEIKEHSQKHKTDIIIRKMD